MTPLPDFRRASTRTRIETLNSVVYLRPCHFSGGHPREQGLKLEIAIVVAGFYPVSGGHPREQGLKLTDLLLMPQSFIFPAGIHENKD